MGKLLGSGGQLFSLPVETRHDIYPVRKEELDLQVILIEIKGNIII